jgi:hypothetical protein
MEAGHGLGRVGTCERMVAAVVGMTRADGSEHSAQASGAHGRRRPELQAQMNL